MQCWSYGLSNGFSTSGAQAHAMLCMLSCCIYACTRCSPSAASPSDSTGTSMQTLNKNSGRQASLAQGSQAWRCYMQDASECIDHRLVAFTDPMMLWVHTYSVPVS